MATKKAQIRKPMNASKKGLICLLILVALTVFVSCLAIFGMNLGGVTELGSWIPVSSTNWPDTLPLSRALGGGTYKDYLIPEGTDDETVNAAVATIRSRLEGYGETDSDVSVKNGILHMELRNMGQTRLTELRASAVTKGLVEFVYTYDDNSTETLFTGKDVVSSSVGASYSNNQLSSYDLTMKVTPEVQAMLAENAIYYLTVNLDGATYGTAEVTSDGLVISFSADNYRLMTNFDFFLRTGSVDVDLSNTRTDSGSLDAPLNIVVKVVLWVSAALLVLAVIYAIVVGKLTGVSAALSIWWAVVIELFLVAAVALSSITCLTTGCMIAILLGILLAVYTAVTRTDAISKQIGEGAAPKNAAKLGFKMTAKTVWLLHAAALAVSLILMIFAATRPTGYCLFVGVLASAIAVLVMRAFLACFTAITNKASSFGKAQ